MFIRENPRLQPNSRTNRDHDARFADVHAARPMYDADVRYLELLVSFDAQALHFGQRHRVIGFINEIQRLFAFGPFACIAVERDRRATLRQHHAPRYRTHIDRLRR